ncbi:MAG: hypothetical protein KDA25_05455 [Phycisphaerales bacterium]|nr:hypothetical protein [Phycisphaerales bacterium]
MRDPQDMVDIDGLRTTNPGGSGGGRATPKFVQVWYRCCHRYGRMSRNREGTQYIGRCPKCGAVVSARIGPGGTNRRLFEAQ